MNRPLHSLGLLPILLLMSAGVAHAAPEDDYVALMTAIEIDKACVALKYMESSTVRGIAYGYLERTPQFSQSQDGRVSVAEYDAWRAELDERALAAAATVDCTQQAMSYVLTAKAAASDELYRGLALAFHFDALPWEDFNRVELDDHQKKSATGYEAYLAQLYGQNFQAFAERQKQAAFEMLPPDTLGLSTWNWTANPEDDSARIWNTQAIAAGVMEKVQFEVTAEANGYFVRPYDFATGMTAPALQRPDMDRALPVVDGPKYRLMNHGEGLIRLHSVAAMLPDRRLSLFFFGETAATKMADATVRLYVRQPPYHEGVDGYTIFDQQTSATTRSSLMASSRREPASARPATNSRWRRPMPCSPTLWATTQSFLSRSRRIPNPTPSDHRRSAASASTTSGCSGGPTALEHNDEDAWVFPAGRFADRDDVLAGRRAGYVMGATGILGRQRGLRPWCPRNPSRHQGDFARRRAVRRLHGLR